MSRPETTPTITWDIDGVKARSAPAIIDSANRTFGLRLRPEDYQVNFVTMTRQPQKAVSGWWRTFCHEQFPLLEPVEGMREVIEAFDRLRHVQLTTRRPEFRSITEAWTNQHYGSLMQALYMQEIDWEGDPNAHMVTKWNAFRAIKGAVCHIDDELRHPFSIAAARHWGIYLQTEPWQPPVPEDRPPTLLVARSPAEVGEFIADIVLPALTTEQYAIL